MNLRWTPRLAVSAMLVTVLIYAGNFVFSRWAAMAGLTSGDLTGLRYVFAAPFVVPLFLREGFRNCGGVGWGRGIVLAVASGAPMTLLTNVGFVLSSASHGAALAPGTVTLVGVVAGAILTGILPPAATIAGLLMVASGLGLIALSGTTASSALTGDLCFIAAGLLWGAYPVLLHRWRVGAFAGAAVAVVLSLPYSVGYFLFGPSRVLDVSPWLVVGQGFYQGAVTMLLGLWLWGSAVCVLGAARTQLFPPLIPVVGTLLAIPLLGERPGLVQASGMVAIVGGLLLAAWSNRRGQRLPAAATTGPERPV